MSDLMNIDVPAHIAQRIAERKADTTKKSAVMSAVVSGEGFPFPRISTRASRYRLIEDGVETVVGVNLDCIIVGANPNVSKVFYSGTYDPNATDMRPACFSNDGKTPDASVESPVAANCATCPNNALGSKITNSGAKSKLCADQRHLAVIPAADTSGKIYSLTVPVSGMKALREYFKSLNNYGLVPEEVVTELAFDDKADYPKITFKHKGFAPAKAVAKLEQIANSTEAKVAVRSLPLSALGNQLPAPESKAAEPAKIEAAPAAKPAPVQAVDEAYEEEEIKEESKSDLEKALDDMFE
jgi:hypothetical protein